MLGWTGWMWSERQLAVAGTSMVGTRRKMGQEIPHEYDQGSRVYNMYNNKNVNFYCIALV